MKKELIIIVYYINISGLSRQLVERMLSEIKSSYEHMYDNIDKNVVQYYVPIHGESRVECIYPINNTKENLIELLSSIDKEDLKKLKDTIDEIEKGE